MSDLRVWNAAVTRRPNQILSCESAADVSRALAEAKKRGLPVSVFGGGHHWSGLAVREGGLVVDLRRMRHVTIEGDLARVSGGATSLELAEAAAKHARAAATGNTGAVGVAGLALGGGYGPLTGQLGLSLDTIVEAEVVLADGRIVIASAEREPELFWALRGGGGNFGVVTSLVMHLGPYPNVLTGMILFPSESAPDVLAGCGEIARECPDGLTMLLGIFSPPDGPGVVYVSPTWCGNDAEGSKWIDRITAFARPISAKTGRMPLAAPLREADGMFVPDERRYAYRTLNLGELTPEVVSCLAHAGTHRSPASALSLHQFHGAATRVPVEQTAFGTRTKHFMLEITACWVEGDGAAERAWAEETFASLLPFALPGGYPNFLGGNERDQIAHAYGPNALRLARAKKTYDPDNTFRAIPLPG